jgi:hypothetical protein
MKHQLPQFIETETKIIGPFTIKQFLWVAAGASLLFVVFLTLPGFWAFVLSVPIVGISLSFAFVRIQGVPLVNYMSYMLSYNLNPKKYLYKNEDRIRTDQLK